MAREVFQTVFRYAHSSQCFLNAVSHPAQHLRFVNSVIDSFHSKATVADKSYAGVFISALGISILILCASYYLSRDPIFPKDTLKLPRFRHRHYYDSVAQHAENGNGVEIKERKKTPEPLKGWRFRMGILLNMVLIALVIVHTIILDLSGPTLLRIVFIVYWVYLPNWVNSEYRALFWRTIPSGSFLPSIVDRCTTWFVV